MGASIHKWSGWHLRTPPEKGAPLPATSCCLMAKTTWLSGNFSPRAHPTPPPNQSHLSKKGRHHLVQDDEHLLKAGQGTRTEAKGFQGSSHSMLQRAL